MELIFYMLFALLFSARTSSVRIISEVDRQSLRLPLYHTRSQSHPLQPTEPLSNALALDEARVKFLNSRLTKKINSTEAKSLNVVPLNPGESLGIGNYYTKISIGTPPTSQAVIMDTGSSFSWIQCQPCIVYCHTQVGSTFNPSDSTTYQKVSCGTSQCNSLKEATLNTPTCSSKNTCIYTATYGDQSYSMGYLSRDSINLGSESLPGFVFGCGQDNTGLFGKSDGLIGLAKNELSLSSQLSATKYGGSGSFSYCLPTGKSGAGGFLAIGESSNTRYKFTPMLSDSSDSTLYFLQLSSIYVSSKPINVASSDYSTVSTIIDSGTTISRLPNAVYTGLRGELVKIISLKYKLGESYSILDACFLGSFDEVSSVLPEVKLVFDGGADLDLGPDNVLFEVEKGTTCLAFAGSSGIAIIGNRQQQTFDVIYDVKGSKIGFAPGGCH